MKHPTQRDASARFSGTLRHYHRSSTQANRTWEEWIDGKSVKTASPASRLKISLIVISVLALGGIITGLIVELS